MKRLGPDLQPIHFKRYGFGDPLLILHGLFGSGDNWQPVARLLADKYAVFALDMRNHGRSFHSDRFDYEAMKDDVVRFIGRHGLNRVSIMGHSMGGKVAMKVAFRHPDLIRRLVVVDMANKAYVDRHQDIVEALYAMDVSKIARLRDADEMLREVIPETDLRLFLLSNLKRKDDGTYHWRINMEGIRNGFKHLSEAVTGTPFEKSCMFIRGGRSDYIEDSDWPAILRYFPRASLTTLPDAGHWVHIEARDPFVDAVLNYLGKGNEKNRVPKSNF